MKHDCQETEPLISGYLDGELTQSDRQRVDLILEECERCSQAFAEMKKLRNSVSHLSFQQLTETEKRDMTQNAISGTGANLGQILAIAGLILVYGVGACWLSWELITDAKFAETGNAEDKVPLFIRFGLPALIGGVGILFFTVLFQRVKAAKTDKYRDVQI
ncbi:MAG: zf-HC2 domain-containing protein [Verrucomicrobia bacterium]|nr:zf-HC2 domain-containing protein [Verrucomicrobiota bacterium]